MYRMKAERFNEYRVNIGGLLRRVVLGRRRGKLRGGTRALVRDSAVLARLTQGYPCTGISG